VAGDGQVHVHEIDVFAAVWQTATGTTPGDDEMMTSVRESVRLMDDPDALQDYLTATPAYLQAVLAMDRERGTRNAEQVVTALGGLGLAVLAADGRAEPEEDSVFTTHLGHLRGELPGS
jgi:hypothetical protein